MSQQATAIASMTGFARAEGSDGRAAWVWEIKAVNGKGLDLRARLPYGMEHLEPAVRQAAQKRFARGNISMNLNLRGVSGGALPRVNRAALAAVQALVSELREENPEMPAPRPEALLALKGVIEVAEEEPDEEERAARDGAILADFERALDELAARRASEGAELQRLVTSHLAAIADLIERAERLAALQPEALRARVREKVEELLAASPALPEERLAQEAALLATKADVREELDRLRAHIEAARGMLEAGGPAGRRLDFLCQEFNREANTLCSKAQDVELTSLGLELKHVIDQLREQVQNIE